MEGGVVNHGYVGDVHPSKPGNNNRAARLPSSSDSTSGYYSAGNIRHGFVFGIIFVVG